MNARNSEIANVVDVDFLQSVEINAMQTIREALLTQGLLPMQAISVASQIAQAITDKITTEWGGQQVYILMRSPRRDEIIFADFTGNNAPQLARKYHMSVRTIHKIIARKTREKTKDSQHRFPGL